MPELPEVETIRRALAYGGRRGAALCPCPARRAPPAAPDAGGVTRCQTHKPHPPLRIIA